MKSITILIVTAFVLTAVSCTETAVDDTLVLTSTEEWSEPVLSSGCQYDNYAYFNGQSEFRDGGWRIEREFYRYGEIIRLRWNSWDYMDIRISDDNGWLAAMDKGRKIDLSNSSGKISAYFNTWDDRDMRATEGIFYLIPKGDGTLEVDFCNVVFKKYYNSPTPFITGSGGINIRP